MEVKTWLVRSLLVSLFVFSLTACGHHDSGNASVNKASNDACANSAISGEKVVHWKDGHFSKIKFAAGNAMAVSNFAAKNAGKIDFIEDNFKLHLDQDASSLSARDWGGTDTWGVDFTRASELWSKNILGDGVIVAIIDSGIDKTHSQLSTQIYSNPNEPVNGIDDDANGLIDDVNGWDFTANSPNLEDTSGHGTHVAGIIAANHDTGKIKGMAPHSKLLVYDFFTADGEGSVGDAVVAIQLAVAHGAKVINASWGGPSCSQSLNVMLDSLSNKNILFVSAAGNESQNIDLIPSYPASYEAYNHITVAAITSDEYTAGFSNYGDKVQIAAPGVNILSTYPIDSEQYLSGTSMAAPFVTGAVALLYSAFPNVTSQQIKTALSASVKPGPYPVKSRGALDVEAAYEYLKSHGAN